MNLRTQKIHQVVTLTIALIFIFCSCMSLTPPSKRGREKVSEEGVEATVGQISVEKAKSIARRGVLLSNRIRAIAADEKSVWVATDRGVSRLNRETDKWVYYTKDDGLGDDNVNAVLSEGNVVWFGTNDGVSRYDTQSGEWKTFKGKDGLKGRSVFCIAIDGNHVWFGTDGGLNRFDKTIDSWAARTKKDGLSSDNVSSIAVTDDYIWVGTRAQVSRDRWSSRRSGGGINRYDKTTDSWNKYSKKNGLVDDQISSIAVDENNVWFGTYNKGISVYNKTDQTFVKTYTKTDVLSSDDIRAIAVDGNHIWIGTANGGALRYIKTVNTWVKYTQKDGLASDNITAIFIYKNEIWFGTYDSGVSVYDKVANTWRTYARADTLPNDDIRAIASDNNGQLWVATADGLAKFDSKNRYWARFGKERGLTTNYITTVVYNNGQLWVGTSRGLGSLNENGWRFYTKHNGIEEEFITTILAAEKGVWAGTNHGLFYKNKSSKHFTKVIQLGDGAVRALAKDEDILWVGTKKGLYRYDVTSKEVTLYTTERGLGDDCVNALLAIKGDVFAGTLGGLSIYDESIDGFKTITKADGFDTQATQPKGLPNDNVRALAYGSKNHFLWIGTPAGLARYDVQTGKCASMNSEQNHFASYNIKAMRVVGDTLWLGTTSGVVEFDIANWEAEEYRSLVTRQPLRESGVSNIEFDGDYIWFSNWSRSHNGAIVRFDRRSNTWQLFTRETVLGDTESKSMTRIKYIKVDGDLVWFSTDYGLLKYDKKMDNWEHFTIEDGMASNDIEWVAPGRNVVWVSFDRGQKICKYDKKTGEWDTIKLSEILYPRDRISAIAADGDDVWVGFWSSGLRKVSADGKETFFKTVEGEPRSGIRWLCVDGDELWSANWRGSGQGAVSRYNKKTGEWKEYSSTDVLEDDWINKIVVGEKLVWIIYRSWREGGVTGYDREMDEWTTIKPKSDWGSEVTELCEDGDYLWLAVRNGLQRFHMASGTWTSFDENSGMLSRYVTDRALKVDENYVWVGTERGLSRYDKKTESWTNFTRRSTLAGKRVHAVAVDERYVWCGTSEGISRFDKTDGTWRNFRKRGGYQRRYYGGGYMSWWEPESHDSLVDNAVSALAVGDRYLWVGTRGGANRYDRVTDNWDRFTTKNGLPGEDISSVVVDGYNVWMGTNAGLAKFPRKSDDLNAWVSYTSGIEIKPGAVSKEFAATLVSNEVWCVATDEEYVWVGTMRGVSRYDKKKDTWATFTTEDGLPTNSISTILVDGEVIWFGSDSGATTYNKKTQDWKNFTVDDGLASNRITCIVKDGDELWFGTFDAGLMKYDKKTKRWQNYTRKDGLAHNCVLSIAVDTYNQGAYLWIGTQRGLSRFDKTTQTWTTFTENQDSEDV